MKKVKRGQNFKEGKRNLYLIRGEYEMNNGLYLGLETRNGEIYADVTVNLGNFGKDIVALSSDLDNCSLELRQDVKNYLFEEVVGSVRSGFVTCELYKLKPNIIEEIPTFEQRYSEHESNEMTQTM